MAFPYRITPDIDGYDGLIPTSGYEKFRLLDGTRRSESWIPVPVKKDPATNRANRGKPVEFPALAGLGYAISKRALEVLYPLIGEKIEALPLDCGSESYYAINVLNVIDCLDEDRSELKRLSSGKIDVVLKHAFKPGSTDGQHIFKLKQKPLGHVYVSDAFKCIVDDHKLTGLIFEEVGAAVDRERTERGR